MKLINATPSPYGRKVAIALKEKAIAYEVQYDVPWGEGTCVGDFSPLQQLPILLTDDGESIYDSAFILDWLELRYPDPPLLPTAVEPRIKELRLRLLGERLMEIGAFIPFEVQRPEPSQAWLDRQSRKLRTGIAEVSRLIGNRRPGSSDPISQGDIAVGSTLLMFEFLIAQKMVGDVDAFHWRGAFQNLDAYCRALDERPSFAATRPQMFKLDLGNVVKAHA